MPPEGEDEDEAPPARGEHYGRRDSRRERDGTGLAKIQLANADMVSAQALLLKGYDERYGRLFAYIQELLGIIREKDEAYADLLKRNADDKARETQAGVDKARIAAKSNDLAGLYDTIQNVGPVALAAYRVYRDQEDPYAEALYQAVGALFASLQRRDPDILTVIQSVSKGELYTLNHVMASFAEARRTQTSGGRRPGAGQPAQGQPESPGEDPARSDG